MITNNILDEIKTAANKRILYLPHAIRQISRPDCMISPEEVRNVIEQGEIIEDYPVDQRGHSCLISYYSLEGRPLHVVCAPKVDYLAVITAYIPSAEEWEENYTKRKKYEMYPLPR
jgi:hypothetical protein